ncbi:hypothetical protein JI735_10260 [Paenibacillus sonchi]|uniref:Uncharacterized protein n=1 Tax=Paenibacillus sonchi TaxID=373687 RepID=A0A974PFH5_9BACL|nr:hypothetical protein [Paenibacillus sonchi]QQZ62870.1 hypothetical protein JI735_10260 [Paenibacillus sonchi]
MLLLPFWGSAAGPCLYDWWGAKLAHVFAVWWGAERTHAFTVWWGAERTHAFMVWWGAKRTHTFRQAGYSQSVPAGVKRSLHILAQELTPLPTSAIRVSRGLGPLGSPLAKGDLGGSKIQ